MDQPNDKSGQSPEITSLPFLGVSLLAIICGIPWVNGLLC